MAQCSDSHASWPSHPLKTRICLGGNASHTAVSWHGIRQRPDFIYQLQTPSPLQASRSIFNHQLEKFSEHINKDGVRKSESTSSKVHAAENEHAQLGTIQLEVLLAKRTKRRSVPGKRHEFSQRRVYERFSRHPTRASQSYSERDSRVGNRRGSGLAQTPPDSRLTGGAVPGTSEETGDPLDKSGVSQENRREISAGTKHPEGTHAKTIVNKRGVFETLCRSRVSFILIDPFKFRCLCFEELFSNCSMSSVY